MIEFMSEFGKTLFILGSALLAFKCFMWTRQNEPQWEYNEFTHALMLMSVALCITSLWWFTARVLSPDHLPHEPWMLANSGYQTIGTGSLYLYGVLKFVKFVERYTRSKISMIGAACLLIGAWAASL